MMRRGGDSRKEPRHLQDLRLGSILCFWKSTCAKPRIPNRIASGTCPNRPQKEERGNLVWRVLGLHGGVGRCGFQYLGTEMSQGYLLTAMSPQGGGRHVHYLVEETEAGRPGGLEPWGQVAWSDILTPASWFNSCGLSFGAQYSCPSAGGPLAPLSALLAGSCLLFQDRCVLLPPFYR